MKNLTGMLALAALVVATGMVLGHAQGRPDPFFDHADNGELIHILPAPATVHSPRDTQPTDAAPHRGTAVLPASYGSCNLIVHGGKEISNAGFMAIYWKTSVSSSTKTSNWYGTIKQQIDAFVTAFGSGTTDYTIIQQYGSKSPIAPMLANAGFYLDNQPLSSKISDTSIRNYLASLFNAKKLTASENTIYGIYFPPGMRVQLTGGTSCSSFCGYHSHFTYGTKQIKYASFPYLNCAGCSLAGKSVADMLTIVTSHEIREAVTDPVDNNVYAWYDAAGYEGDDKCAWHNLYQMSAGGHWVQPEYSNGLPTFPGPGCIVP